MKHAFRLIFFLTALGMAQAEEPAAFFSVAPPSHVDAEAVIVTDMAKGETLYEYHADDVISPASLTKIMTMMVALNAVRDGHISLTTRIKITREDATLPYRSSLMYLREGMNVTFDDLLRGMAVVSGNDAAMTVARVVAGSMDAFVARMNAEAKKLGLVKTFFVEPSGLSELNTTTAREMALLARIYMLRYPDAIKNYHSNTSMRFPRADVMPDGIPEPFPPIILRATNRLLLNYPGCDGLKTGYIDEAGYNLIATAERDGTRFIVVSLGGHSGVKAREQAGRTLLDWAFAEWRTIQPHTGEMPKVRVWGGKQKYIAPVYAETPAFTVPQTLAAGVACRIEALRSVDAPLAAGTKLGTAVFTNNGIVVRRIDIIAQSDIEKSNIFVRIRDAIIKLFSRG